jgi:uncharacterized membrane protein YbhN (UPF0104 family)
MWRRSLLIAIKIAVTTGLVGLLLARIDLGAVIGRLQAPAIDWAAAALCVMFVQLALAAWRWALIAKLLRTPLDAGAIIRLSAIGQFFNQTLPSAIGGDAVRAWMAGRRRPPMARAAAAVIVDRLVALAILTLLIAITLPLFFHRIADGTARLGVSAIAAAGVISAVVLWRLGDPITRAFMRRRWTRLVGGVLEDLRGVSFAGRSSAGVIALAFAVHAMVAGVVYLTAEALGMAIAPVDCLLLVPPIILFTMVPISLAGWGVREGAMVVGFGLVGVPAADALALSVAFGLVNAITGLPGGLLWLIGERRLPRAIEIVASDRDGNN